MERANAEADRLQDEYVGVEHLLIAIADEREGESARILGEFEITRNASTRRCGKSAAPLAVDRRTAGVELPGAGEVQPRPHRVRGAGQARPGDRPRGRGRPRHAGPQPAHEEQPGADRRSRCRQDGDRRGLAQTMNVEATCRRTCAASRVLALDMGAARRRVQVPRRVRGAAAGDHARDPRTPTARSSCSSTKLHQVVGAGGAEGAIDASEHDEAGAGSW